MAGHLIAEHKIDDERILPAIQPVARLVGTREDGPVGSPGVQTGETSPGRQKSLGFLDRREGPEISRHDHHLVNLLHEVGESLPVRHALPVNGQVVFLPDDLVQEGRPPFERGDVLGFEGPDKGGPVVELLGLGVAEIGPDVLLDGLPLLAEDDLGAQFVPELIAVDPVHAPVLHAGQVLGIGLQGGHLFPMGLQIRMGLGSLQGVPVGVHEHVPGLTVDRAVGVQRLQMSQEAGGQVAVAAAPFLDNECGGKVGLCGCVVVKVNSQGVRQAVIDARHRLVVVPDLSPAEPVEDGIDVGLPVVHQLELADELRGRLFVRRQRGNDAHNAAGFYHTYFLDA